MSKLVLDAETKKTFKEVGGKSQTHALGVTVVGVYDYDMDKYLIFTEDTMNELEDLIAVSDCVIGFNIIGFDWLVIQPYFEKINLFDVPTVDILKDIEKEIGYRVSLESVAQATIGEGKTGDGLDAIKYYREGRMEELKKYCLDDVRVTRDVYDSGVKNGEIWFQSGWEKYPVPVKWE